MEVKAIVQEIQRLPLSKRFFIMEQTLKSIKNEELNQQSQNSVDGFFDNYSKDTKNNAKSYLASQKSLAKDWLSADDDRWDNLL